MIQIDNIVRIKIEEMEKEKVEVKHYLTPMYKASTREKDRCFPESPEDYDYEAYLVGISDAKTDVQYNFKFANGK